MRKIAFYLPQFHRVPENDHWWGQGFTEWVNVARAVPQFRGHAHPRVPEAGEYDLTDSTVFVDQTSTARKYGVDAFCMYFYWFDGKRLLEGPLEAYRRDPSLLPYCLSWANESWTRRWDGKDSEVLMPQTYEAGFAEGVFEAWLPHFMAPHYLRQQDKPILLLHRPDLVPGLRSVVGLWRSLARSHGLPGLYVVGAETKPGLDPRVLGLDAMAEFPPVGANTLAAAQLRPLRGVDRAFRGKLLSYERLVQRFSSRPTPRFVRHRAVTPMWDNTARRGANATVYVGSTPRLFREWLVLAEKDESRLRGGEGLLFVNAWNEWAEGAYLEKDTTHGDGYLRALSDDVDDVAVTELQWAALPDYPQVRSWLLLALGSLLALLRRVRFRLQAVQR